MNLNNLIDNSKIIEQKTRQHQDVKLKIDSLTTKKEFMESVDETKTFAKWDGDTIPSSVAGLSTYQGPYTHSEIMVILNTEEWVGTGST